MAEKALLPQRMHTQADRWEAAADRRFLFLRCYSLMTGNMLTAIENSRFSDSVWVEKLLLRFADYYFDALELYDAGDARAPAVWKQAHDASRGRNLHVLQHILLGINAHINYDLVLALYDALHDSWATLPDAQRQQRAQDHDTVNSIIAETIDAVQDDIIERYSPSMNLADRLLGRVDEWLLSQLISSWRNDVWDATLRMLDAQSDMDREKLRQALESEVLRRAEQLLLI